MGSRLCGTLYRESLMSKDIATDFKKGLRDDCRLAAGEFDTHGPLPKVEVKFAADLTPTVEH
jgi:hypothetical protein